MKRKNLRRLLKAQIGFKVKAQAAEKEQYISEYVSVVEVPQR